MSVIKWTSQRRCIFNRIFQDNVLCIASPSTRWFTWICTSNRGDLVGQQYVTRYLRTSLRLKRYFPVRPIRIILDESSNELERKKKKKERKKETASVFTLHSLQLNSKRFRTGLFSKDGSKNHRIDYRLLLDSRIFSRDGSEEDVVVRKASNRAV